MGLDGGWSQEKGANMLRGWWKNSKKYWNYRKVDGQNPFMMDTSNLPLKKVKILSFFMPKNSNGVSSFKKGLVILQGDVGDVREFKRFWKCLWGGIKEFKRFWGSWKVSLCRGPKLYPSVRRANLFLFLYEQGDLKNTPLVWGFKIFLKILEGLKIIF